MRVYEENKGWDVAKFLLGNERTGIARLGKSKERVKFAKEMAREVRENGRPLIEDPAFRQRIAQLEVDMKALEITQYARRLGARQGSATARPDPLSSVLKVKGTELLQATTELAMDVGGPLSMPIWARGTGGAVERAGRRARSGRREATGSYLFLRAASIYGGTNEIQKNISDQGRAGAVTAAIRHPGARPTSHRCLRPDPLTRDDSEERLMDFDLSDEQRLLKDSVDRLLADRYSFDQRKNYLPSRTAGAPRCGRNTPNSACSACRSPRSMAGSAAARSRSCW